MIFSWKLHTKFCFQNLDIFHKNLTLNFPLQSLLFLWKSRLRFFLSKVRYIPWKFDTEFFFQAHFTFTNIRHWVMLFKKSSFEFPSKRSKFVTEFHFFKTWYLSWKFDTEFSFQQFDARHENSWHSFASKSSMFSREFDTEFFFQNLDAFHENYQVTNTEFCF